MGLFFFGSDYSDPFEVPKLTDPQDTRQYSCLACGRTHNFDTWSKFLPAWVCPTCQCSHIEEVKEI